MSEQKLCECDEPFPAWYPAPDGAECDNCGGWIPPTKANEEGAKRLEEAFKKEPDA
jgi:hypothetical protein